MIQILFGMLKLVMETILREGLFFCPTTLHHYYSSILRTPVQCDDIIRLEHVKTQKNLHSHNFESPIAKQQEVSCLGTNGVGDERLPYDSFLFSVDSVSLFLFLLHQWITGDLFASAIGIIIINGRAIVPSSFRYHS